MTAEELLSYTLIGVIVGLGGGTGLYLVKEAVIGWLDRRDNR